jgi:two-component system response regulator FlrC
LEPEAVRRIVSGSWPGNVRELANALERAAILADGEVVTAGDLAIPGLAISGPVVAAGPVVEAAAGGSVGGSAGEVAGGEPRPLVDLERDAIEAALKFYAGNRTRAAEALGIGVRTLYDKIKRYGLEEEPGH